MYAYQYALTLFRAESLLFWVEYKITRAAANVDEINNNEKFFTVKSSDSMNSVEIHQTIFLNHEN